jgi:alpha-L-arabinofuranosidase
MQGLFRQWDAATTMRCAIFEENGGLHNMQRALGHATNLNAVRRHGDFLLTACPANALQPWLQNDNGWDQGQIFFTPDSVWGMPPFYVQQLAAANFLPYRVRDTTEGSLDVTATRDESGRNLVLHIVNTTAAAVDADIHLDGWQYQARTVKCTTIAAPLAAENGPENHAAVRPIEQTLDTFDKSGLQHRFPPYSYTVVRITP